MNKWGTEEQPQTILQWRRMLWMREYRKKIKENEIIYRKKIKENEVIYIKKNSIIKKKSSVIKCN